MASILRAGGDGRNILLAVDSGEEYARTRGGGTKAGFVDATYRDVLQRSPRDDEASFWVGRLDAGASRRGVIRSILDSDEAVIPRVRSMTAGTPEAGTPEGQARAARLYRTTGGANRLVAATIGARSVFDRATQVDTTVAPPSDSGPSAHPPGVPMAPGLNLATSWTELSTTDGPTLDGSNLVTAASDGSIWVTGPNGQRDQLYVLTPATFSGPKSTNLPSWRTLAKLPEAIQSFSAASNNMLFAVGTDGSLIQVDGAGNTSPVASPTPLSGISAASDGTLMALTATTVIVRAPGQSAWTTLPPFSSSGIVSPRSVSTGSSDHLFAVFRGSDGVNHVARYLSGAWVELTNIGLDSSRISGLSATSDGALWVCSPQDAAVRSPITGNFQVVNSTIVQDFNGVTSTLPVTAPGAIGIGAAVSENRLAVGLGPNNQQAYTLQALNLGIADQQSVPMLPTNPTDLAFYDDITAFLNIAPGGIRSVYDTTGEGNLNVFYSRLQGFTPTGVDPTDPAWVAFRGTILNEINDVIAIQHLFASLDTITATIKSNNNTIRGSIEQSIKLSVSVSGNQTVLLTLEAVDQALSWGLAADFGDPDDATGAIIGSIYASAVGSTTSLVTGDPTQNANKALSVAYSQLSNTLLNLYQGIDNTNLAYETSILTDWSRVTRLGSLLTGPAPAWNPPIGSEQSVADATTPSWELFFYQALMPAKWQDVIIAEYDYDAQYFNDVTYCVPDYPPVVPAWDFIATSLGTTREGCPKMQYVFLNQVGSSGNPFSPDSGPYPTQDVIQAIAALGVSKFDLLTSGGGFNFHIVNGPDGP